MRGLGSLEIREWQARKARNPKTGEPVDIPPRKAVFFCAGRELKRALAIEPAGSFPIRSES